MVSRITTTHQDLIHDAQLDFYGKRLATCSGDRTIKVYDLMDNGERHMVADLTGHTGPVWQVAWAHPKYGSILASCGYDRQVYVWKEHAPNHWGVIFTYSKHEGSVNAIAWAPTELGLRLACASSDETISVLTHNADDSWGEVRFLAHKTGVNAVAWAPVYPAGAMLEPSTPEVAEARLATGGCDNRVKLWRCHSGGDWEADEELAVAHTDWVRDVAWAPGIGNVSAVLVSCSQDKKVIIWTRDSANSRWATQELVFGCALWRVSWSVTGNILAVSGSDNLVTLWKQNLLGKWEQLGQLADTAPAH